MNFFELIQLSSYQSVNLAYHDDAPNTPVPSRLLCFQYSKLHNRQPKNAFPNISYPIRGILAGAGVMFSLLTFLLSRLYLMMEGIQHAYAHGLYS